MSTGKGIHDVRERRPHRVRSVRLPNESGSVKVARDEVATALRDRGWPDHSIDRARVVVSELVTNAVLHAGTWFELTIRVDGAVWIEVSDGAPADLPERVTPGGSRPGGMGLHLIDAMTVAWGVECYPTRKVVWAQLSDDGSDES